jgi:hypothetical protein
MDIIGQLPSNKTAENSQSEERKDLAADRRKPRKKQRKSQVHQVGLLLLQLPH